MALDDKIQSKGDELKGTAKEKIGEATDSQDLKNEGSSDKAKGKLGQVVEAGAGEKRLVRGLDQRHKRDRGVAQPRREIGDLAQRGGVPQRAQIVRFDHRPAFRLVDAGRDDLGIVIQNGTSSSRSSA